VAGKRPLIVLDNARDAEQVRPLLPGSPGSMAVVTSRDWMAGLAATDGAEVITVGVPGEAEARALIARRVGTGRSAAEPDAVAEIAELCGRLPLALAVAAARQRLARDSRWASSRPSCVTPGTGSTRWTPGTPRRPRVRCSPGRTPP
jgi:hypothetical protein